MPEGVGNILSVPGYSTKSATTNEEILYSYVGYTQGGVIIESGSGFLYTGTVLRAGIGAGKYRGATKAGSLTGITTDQADTVTITGTPTGGTFTLTFSAQTTTAIPFNATAAQVQAALAALSTIGAGTLGEPNVVVTGGPGPGTAFTVTFAGTLADTAETLTTTGSFTGGSSPAVAVAQVTAGGTAGSASETPLLILRKDTDATSTDVLANVVMLGIIKGDKIKFTDQITGGLTALELKALATVLGGRYNSVFNTLTIRG